VCCRFQGGSSSSGIQLDFEGKCRDGTAATLYICHIVCQLSGAYSALLVIRTMSTTVNRDIIRWIDHQDTPRSGSSVLTKIWDDFRDYFNSTESDLMTAFGDLKIAVTGCNDQRQDLRLLRIDIRLEMLEDDVILNAEHIVEEMIRLVHEWEQAHERTHVHDESSNLVGRLMAGLVAYLAWLLGRLNEIVTTGRGRYRLNEDDEQVEDPQLRVRMEYQVNALTSQVADEMAIEIMRAAGCS
jgi:hypothetical protein